MGSDIDGFVECRAWHLHEDGEESVWMAAIDLYFLNIRRSYDAFGCLFGFRNIAGFVPVAAERGIPADASERVRAELDRAARSGPESSQSPTWITWAELKAIDWEERAEGPGPSGRGRSAAIRRRDAIPEDGDWKPVWTVMESLAALHGDDNVRLVVWFHG